MNYTELLKQKQAIIDWLLFDGMDCPRIYNGSVWCHRICPVWGRYDTESKHECTADEILELAMKEIGDGRS